MAAYDLPYCCCGCSLRTGVLFAGWYSLISALLGLIFVGKSASNMLIIDCNYYGFQVAAICVVAFLSDSTLIRGVLTLYGVHTKEKQDGEESPLGVLKCQDNFTLHLQCGRF